MPVERDHSIYQNRSDMLPSPLFSPQPPHPTRVRDRNSSFVRIQEILSIDASFALSPTQCRIDLEEYLFGVRVVFVMIVTVLFICYSIVRSIGGI